MQMLLNDQSSLPLHSRLEQRLREKIESHEWPTGFQLPSERELCESYGVSRITVRRALKDLAVHNLVRSTPGKGTFVILPAIREPLQPLSSFSEDMRRRGFSPSSRILQAEIIPASENIARSLNLPVGSEVVHLQRLRMVAPEDIPVAIQTALIPHSRCPNLLRFDLENRSLYEVFRDEYHLVLERGETVISSRLASSTESEQLRIKQPAAVLISDQITRINTGEVIESVNSVFRSDLYQLTLFK
jgi:GntR family transcriptional regulator